MKIKLIVFDWDCTIVNSVIKIYACKKYLAEKYNHPAPSEQLLREALGMPFKEAMKMCFPFADQHLLIALCAEFHYLMQQDEYQADLFPGAYKMLSEMKKQEIKLAVATSKARIELDRALEYLNVSHLLDLTCCGEEYEEKPNPAMLNYAMQTFNVKAEECLMIGDTITDIAFANNASVKSACVTFGSHSRERLSMLKPMALIDNWSQLQELILCLETV